MNLDAVRIALEEQQRNPLDFGCCVRSLRALISSERAAQAHGIARAFAGRHGAPLEAGDTLFDLVVRAPFFRVQAGDPLVLEGAEGDALFVIVAGEGGVKRLGVGQLATLTPGTVVGEIAPLTGTARTATVYARWPLDVVAFDEAALAALEQALPMVCARLRETGRTRMLGQLAGADTVLNALADAERAALYDRCLPCTLPEGTRVIREGHPGSAMCIIAAGQADVWRRTTGGGRQVLTTLGPGDVFGEMALLIGGVASATVEAISPLTIHALDKASFDEVMARFPAARARLTELAEARLREHPRASDVELPVVRVMRTPPPIKLE